MQIIQCSSDDRSFLIHFDNFFASISLIIGKTTFALSLPGVVNYYHGIWSLKAWRNDARYMVINDIPWDNIGQGYCPDKKALLTGNDDVTVSVHFFPTDEQLHQIHWNCCAALGP